MMGASSNRSMFNLLLAVVFLLAWTVEPFAPSFQVTTTKSPSSLFATKKKKASSKKKKTPIGGGFGGASMAPCPCGSGESYKQCCGILHRDTRLFKQATAEQVVRARYAAFALKQPGFLMASTHPLNKEFTTDLRAWKESIRLNMYDKFDLPKCTIVDETYDTDSSNTAAPTKAVVQFIAQMVLKETGEVTAFMETANLERFKPEGAPWLYVNGTIDSVPEDYARDNNIQLREHADDDEKNEDAISVEAAEETSDIEAEASVIVSEAEASVIVSEAEA